MKILSVIWDVCVIGVLILSPFLIYEGIIEDDESAMLGWICTFMWAAQCLYYKKQLEKSES